MADRPQKSFTTTWRPEHRSGSRWLARSLFTLMFLGLSAALAYILLSPFWLPASYFAMLNPHTATDSAGTISRSELEAFFNPASDDPRLAEVRVEQRLNLVHFGEARSSGGLLGGVGSRSLSQATLGRITGPNYRNNDVLVVYVSGNGIITSNGPRFVFTSSQADSLESPTVSLDSLLARLRSIPAGTKLLLVDLQPEFYCAENGQVAQLFPSELRQAIEASRDPTLWAMCSNADYEIPRHSALLNKSHFAIYARAALAGQVDQNQDGKMDLGEFRDYVVARFRDGTAIGGFSAQPQRPQLSWGGGRIASSQALPILASSQQKPFSASVVIAEYEMRQAATDAALAKNGTANQPMSAPSDGPTSAGQGEETATPTDNTDSTAADTGDGDEQAVGEDGSPAATGPPQPKTFRDILAETWKFQQQLNQSRNINPVAVAPQIWRQCEHSIAAFDDWSRADDSLIPTQVVASLQQIQFMLERLLRGDSFENERFPAFSTMSGVLAAQNASKFKLSEETPLARQKVKEFIDSDKLSVSEWILANQEISLAGCRSAGLILEFADVPEIPLSVLKKVIALEYRSEELLAEHGHQNSKLLDRWSVFDEYRLATHRQLTDRIDSQWLLLAESNLAQAINHLNQIESVLSMVSDGIAIRETMLYVLPEYLRLRGIIGNDLATHWLSRMELEKAIQSIEVLNAELRADVQDIASLARIVSQLRDFAQVLNRDFATAVTEDFQAIEAMTVQSLAVLARSPLVRPQDRLRLIEAAEQREFEVWNRLLAEETDRSALPLTMPRAPVGITDQIAVEARRLLVAGDQLLATETRQLLGELALLNDESIAGQDVSQYLIDLAAAYSEVSRVLGRALLNTKDMTNLEEREAKSQQLADCRQLAKTWSFPAPTESLAIELAQQLSSAAKYEILYFAMSRLAQSLLDADTLQTESIRTRQKALQLQAAELSTQPALLGPASDDLRLSIPKLVSMESEREATVNLTLSSSQSEPTACWIVVEFDTQKFTLLNSESGVYSQTELQQQLDQKIAAAETQYHLASSRSSAGGASSSTNQTEQLARLHAARRYPLRPDLAGLPSTLILPPHQPTQLPIRIRRNYEFGEDATIAVHMVSPRSARRETLVVSVRAPRSTGLRMADGREFWKPVFNGVELYPSPNSQRTFRPELVNLTATTQELSVELLIPESQLMAIPAGKLNAQQGRRYFDSIPPTRRLHPAFDVTIGPGEAVPLVLPEPIVVPGADPAAAAAQPAAEAVIPPPQKTPSGLVVVVRNRQTGSVELHSLAITAQRPSRMVTPSLSYDANTGKLSITIRAGSTDVLPFQGVRIHVELKDDLSKTFAKGDVWLSREKARATMELFVPKAVTNVNAIIDFGDYPRAFRYAFSSNQTLTRYETQDKGLSVRVVSPLENTVFTSPVDFIPVDVQVDASEGAFPYPWNNNDRVEVGVDANLDRQLQGEPIVQLTSDRQVQIRSQLAPSGLDIGCIVTDFRLQVPADRIINGRANILARMVAGKTVRWSEPVEVVFDGVGPDIDTVVFSGGSTVATDQPLELSIRPAPQQLTPVEKIEVAVDTARRGVFSDDLAVVQAKLQTGNEWLASLDVSLLPPGRYNLLLRATDAASNTGEIKRVSFQVIAPPPPDETQGLNKISGIFSYESRGAANAQIVLTALEILPDVAAGAEDTLAAVTADKPLELVTQTDERGYFEFNDLKPGRYALKATVIAKNRPRIATADIQVRPAPAPPNKLLLDAE